MILIIDEEGDNKETVHISSLHIKNYRLLIDVVIPLDCSLTLFVGKNNTAKTSIMHLFRQILEGKKLEFDDYPFRCRKVLYDLLDQYYRGEIVAEDLAKSIPSTGMRLTIDYALETEDAFLGALSFFIIDLDSNLTHALVDVSYRVIQDPESILEERRDRYAGLNDDEFNSFARDLFSSLFELHIKAVNPSDETDTQVRELANLKSLFEITTISAERSLDESDSKEKNPLSPILNRLFASNIDSVDESIRKEITTLTAKMESFSSEAQQLVNISMREIVKSMMSFGYPGAEELALKTTTSLSLLNQIISNTDLSYSTKDSTEVLPSTHNGLGYKNLIKITLILHEFARIIESGTMMIPLLFIEEPEAHMHPQLQTAFAKFINDFLANITGAKAIQVIMTTHSSHIANTIPFTQVRYMKRQSDSVICKSLIDFSQSPDKKQHQEFLEKYLKVSNCDLYFCDKAILVEGASERLLLPYFIAKCKANGLFGDAEIPLSSQYYTIIEVGGAYAHRFYDFVDFLEIPTLILTDIDFVSKARKNCQRDCAASTSNGAILQWYRKKLKLGVEEKVMIDSLLELREKDDFSLDGVRMLMFQYEEGSYHPRTLEDAIINVNRELFDITDSADIASKVKEYKKTDFALMLMMDKKYGDLKIPSYITKGLKWLNDQATMGTLVRAT